MQRQRENPFKAHPAFFAGVGRSFSLLLLSNLGMFPWRLLFLNNPLIIFLLLPKQLLHHGTRPPFLILRLFLDDFVEPGGGKGFGAVAELRFYGDDVGLEFGVVCGGGVGGGAGEEVG